MAKSTTDYVNLIANNRIMSDQRLALMKAEVTDLINDKTEMIKQELAEAAIRSRRVMYTNAAISCGLAGLVALLSFIYRHATAGELDSFLVYRVAMVGCGTFTAALALLKVSSAGASRRRSRGESRPWHSATWAYRARTGQWACLHRVCSFYSAGEACSFTPHN